MFPRQVHGVEIVNASRSDDVNEMARLYAEHYGLLSFAGSDNHSGSRMRNLAGMYSSRKIADE
ncbi:MAG: hypothetical protein IJZ83_08485 [Clostridia bacterium]|nr:hypothetical protein [Clostridia bacterium]